MIKRFKPILTAAALAFCSSVHAFEPSVHHSFFGTVQYSLSTEPVPFERFVTDRGTLRHNTLLGYQADARFTENIGGTLQAVVQPSSDADTGTEIRVKVANLEIQHEDYSLKVGRLRFGIYLDSKNFDVQHTFTPINPAPEVYLSSRADSYDGATLSKSFSFDSFYAKAEAWGGSFVYPVRDTLNGPAAYRPFSGSISGVTLRTASDNLETTASLARLEADISADSPNIIRGLKIPVQLNARAYYLATGARYRDGFNVFSIEGIRVKYNSDLDIKFPGRPTSNIGLPQEVNRLSSFVYEREINERLISFLGLYNANSDAMKSRSYAAGLKYLINDNQSLKFEVLNTTEKTMEVGKPVGSKSSISRNVFSMSYNWAY